MKTYISVKTKEQLKAVKESQKADEIIVSMSLAAECAFAQGVYILLPDVLRENKLRALKEKAGLIKASKGVVIQNEDEIGFLKGLGFEGEIIAGEFLYSYNSEAVNFYRSVFSHIRFTAPAELTDEELARLEKASGTEFIYKAYGHQKLMTTAQRLNGLFADEKKERFIAVYDSFFEYSEIYTGRPVSMLDKKETQNGRDILLEFTIEDAKDTKAVLETMSVPDYIRGHHFKGIDQGSR